MGRKNRIFKGNLKASQILAVLMLIVMIIRPIMEVSAKPGEITTENPSAEVGKEGRRKSVRRNRWERPISVRREWAKRADV